MSRLITHDFEKAESLKCMLNMNKQKKAWCNVKPPTKIDAFNPDKLKKFADKYYKEGDKYMLNGKPYTWAQWQQEIVGRGNNGNFKMPVKGKPSVGKAKKNIKITKGPDGVNRASLEMPMHPDLRFDRAATCMFKKGDAKKACKEEAKRKKEQKKKLAALKTRKKKCLKVDKSKELQTKLQREYWAITTTKKRKEAIIMELVEIAKCLDKCKLSDCAADDVVKRIVVKALNKNKGKYDPKVTLTRRRAKTAEEEEEELKMSYESSDDDYYPMSGCEEEEEYEEPLFEFSGGNKKKRGNMKLNTGGTEYLKELNIDKGVKGEIMGKSFLLHGGYDSWKKEMSENVANEIKEVSGKGWAACKKKCHVKTLKKLVHEETLSTAYVLRAMAESVIGAAGTTPDKLKIKCTAPKKISGVWKKDKGLFKLVSSKKKGKLIMGFGPSASGKTFWAKNLISILLPKEGAFLSIDGGLYREVSDVYQTIRKAAIMKLGDKGGLTNLVAAGLSLNGIFAAKETKKVIFAWLKAQTSKVNLYVPDTLSGVKYKGWTKYRKYTGSEKDWIGACIYMHKHGKATGKDKGCPFNANYRCFGCTESGTSRQKKEGKKYSNTAYDLTFKRGIAQAKTAKKAGGYLLIHNVGPIKGNISTIELGGKLKDDPNLFTNITTKGKKYNFRIVDDVVAAGYRKRSKSAFCPEAPPLKF
tara:strand:- start:57 stop:2147 length:2091 start_codon:yes stop_codon:yes gene_type:complete